MLSHYDRRFNRQAGACKFSGQFLVTRNALAKSGERVIFEPYMLVHLQVASSGSMEWLQVLEINSETLWLIDDGGVVTARTRPI